MLIKHLLFIGKNRENNSWWSDRVYRGSIWPARLLPSTENFSNSDSDFKTGSDNQFYHRLSRQIQARPEVRNGERALCKFTKLGYFCAKVVSKYKRQVQTFIHQDLNMTRLLATYFYCAPIFYSLSLLQQYRTRLSRIKIGGAPCAEWYESAGRTGICSTRGISVLIILQLQSSILQQIVVLICTFLHFSYSLLFARMVLWFKTEFLPHCYDWLVKAICYF